MLQSTIFLQELKQAKATAAPLVVFQEEMVVSFTIFKKKQGVDDDDDGLFLALGCWEAVLITHEDWR